MRVSDIRIRCSRLGDVMTDSKDNITDTQLERIDELQAKKKGDLTAIQAAELKRLLAKREQPFKLSDTCTQYLMELYIRHKYGRSREIINKAMEKGTQMEEDSITLYARSINRVVYKNKNHYIDADLSGTPDLIMPPVVKDFKTSWDIFTFMKSKREPISKQYEWQLRGYMRMGEWARGELIYTLVDTPDGLVNDEKRRLAWRMGLIDPDINEDYQTACKEIDRLASYDDLPIDDRLHFKKITRDRSLEDAISKRVAECRQYLATTYSDFYTNE